MFKRAFAIITLSSILALTVISVCFAFAQIIYSGILKDFLSLGTVLILAGASLNILIISYFSEISIAVSRPQDEPFPLIVLLAQAITLHFTSGQAALLTVIIALALVTFVTGLLFYVIGYFKWGSLIRFVPYPVIAGFLASAGVLLIINGIEQVIPENLSFHNLNRLFETQSLLLWLPSLAFGLGLFILTELRPSNLLFTGWTVGSLGIFYLLFFLSGLPFTVLKSTNMVLNLEPIQFQSLFNFNYQIEWSYIFSNLGSLFIISLVSIFALLFILISLDVLLKNDIDFNKELKIAGLANIFSSFFGGIVGYHGLANTVLLKKNATRTRSIGIICGLLCFAAIFFSEVTLSYFPRFILSGLIIFLGLSLFYSWTFGIRNRFDILDKSIIVVVIAITALFGFFEGIIAGFIVSILFFTVTYSWISPIRFVLHGNELPYSDELPPVPQFILKKYGEQIIYIKLQNYLFFGSAYVLVMQMRNLLNIARYPVKYVIYDLEDVIGIDSSIQMVFRKIYQYAKKYNFCLIITGYGDNKLIKERVAKLQNTDFLLGFPKVEEAVKFCELGLLKAANYDMEQHKDDRIALEDYLGDKELQNQVSRYFEKIDLNEGDFLFHQNDFSYDLFYLESGRLQIFIELKKGVRKVLANIGPGNFVGEIAFYLHTKRTASIIAESKCVLRKLDHKKLKQMQMENPLFAEVFAQAMIHLLATKLVETNKKVEILSS